MQKLFLALTLVFFTASAHASPKTLAELERLFENRFSTHYQRGRCGTNIQGLVQAAKSEGLNMSSAKVLSIENVGGTVFGLVNAEYTRSSRATGKPSESNWYHHVVLEFACHIFDFDFGNTAQVLPMQEYFERMFLAEDPNATPAYFTVGRAKKLSDYEVTVHHKASDGTQREEKLKLGQFLKRCP